MKVVRVVLFFLFVSFCCSGHSFAADTYLRSVGVNLGLSATGTENYFHQYQVSAVYQLPWQWRAASGWGVATQLDLMAGILSGEGKSGVIGAAGPAFSFGKAGFPLEIDLGVSPTLLSRSKFGNRDYNGPLQFTTHFGVDWRLCRTFGVEYRFQHMSNASIYGGSNPGLNLHLLGANWYFGK